MAARTPDIGSLVENPLRICLSGGMVWISIYEVAEGNLEEAAFGEMVTTSMASPLIIASFKAKAKTAFTIEKQKTVPMWRRDPIPCVRTIPSTGMQR